MKVIHLIGGGDEGGAKSHVLQLIKELGKHIDATLISFRKGKFHDDAVAMGIDARIVKTGNIFLDLRKTLKLVKTGQYDIIHSHGAKANMMASIIRRITGIPVVTTVHSDYHLDYMHSLLKRFTFGIINMIALRRIDYHISVSSNLKEILKDSGFDPQHLYSVNNGIAFDNEIPPCTRKEFFERFNVPFPEDCVLIGIMARLHPVKDHETFLRAAAEVIKANPEARFLIAGPGDELLDHLKQFADKLGLTPYVLFTGMVEKPYDFFQIIDINVLTSISEGFPYVVLEGARFSKVFVSTRVGGLSELVESGVNGYLVEPKDWKTLGAHLSELSLDKNKRERMGEKLQVMAEAEFSLRRMCESQLSIYEAILKEERKNKKDGKKYDITLLGYYGYKNSGDEAILMSTLEAFRKIDPELTFLVFSKKPKETKKLYLVDSVYRFNLFKVIRILKKSRLFLAGGGSLIQDNTSTRSIWYYLTVLKMAKKLGINSMLFANGIGPIKRSFNRRFAGKVLNDLQAISLRDAQSFNEIKALGINKPNIFVSSDPAVLLEASDESKVDELIQLENIPTDKPLIGFSLRKWANSGYVDKIAEIADYCAEKYNSHPVFIPMQYPMDYDISQAIAEKMKFPCSIVTRMYPPDIILGLTARLKVMVGMRLHSIIYAANQCIPLIGLVYEQKVEAFLKEIDQPSAGNIENLDTVKICKQLDIIWENREEICEDLCKSKKRLSLMAEANVANAYHMLKE
ncbi:MAG: polysaccharide pyruvyl transferase CsaB [Acetivibrionales bacterium]|jgi:polysaccharide pyruvyl transferase CsaB